jgi:hypothetical protein
MDKHLAGQFTGGAKDPALQALLTTHSGDGLLGHHVFGRTAGTYNAVVRRPDYALKVEKRVQTPLG